MKKLLLLLATTLYFGSGFAQETASPAANEDKHVRFGIYFAPNISWMHPTASKTNDGSYGVESNGSKVGYTWGLMGEYYFTDNYALTTGFQLNNTGGKIIATSLSTSGNTASTVKKADFNYSIQYFELPLALKLRTDEIAGFRLFGQIGLTLGINIGKKATYMVDYYNTNNVETVKSGDNEKLVGSFTVAPVMMQLNIGGGIEYPITPKVDFYAGLFFNNGFVPDATDPTKFNLGYNGEFKDGNVRLNNLALRIGVLF